MLSLSLAAKCRLLFGMAVALIIGSALFVPWYSLATFVHDRNIQRARHLAVLGRTLLDPMDTNWGQQQTRINQWWDDNAKSLNLPAQKPLLLQLPPPLPGPVSVESLLAPLAGIARLVERPVAAIGGHVRPSPGLALVLGGWRAVPDEWRQWGVSTAAAAGRQVIRTLQPKGLVLDDFRRRCVEAMSKDESLHEMQQPERRAGGASRYRVILAIRGEDTGSGHRPLLGLVEMNLESTRSDAALMWIRVVIILAGFIAGFLAILVFYLIVQKFILAPVRDLTVLAEDIAGGNLNARAVINTGDEFENLGEAFNEMLGQLERARVELETINRSLDTRLGELAETNVALYESNRLKSEFLAVVSHELRTPLASIIGFADLLRDSSQGEGEVDRGRLHRYAHNILVSGRMLLDLINDLLELAKIEAGKVELHRSRFALQDICEGLADFTRPLADKKQLTLVIELDEALPMMNSDAGKVRQVLYNLLSNAIKYTPEGGTIRMEAAPRDGVKSIRLAVTDTGPGIAPEDQERIFERFRQLDSSVTREHGGSGLGLAISKELVHMLGGSIRVDSELGKGARFTVILPVECPETVLRPLPSLT